MPRARAYLLPRPDLIRRIALWVRTENQGEGLHVTTASTYRTRTEYILLRRLPFASLQMIRRCCQTGMAVYLCSERRMGRGKHWWYFV